MVMIVEKDGTVWYEKGQDFYLDAKRICWDVIIYTKTKIVAVEKNSKVSAEYASEQNRWRLSGDSGVFQLRLERVKSPEGNKDPDLIDIIDSLEHGRD